MLFADISNAVCLYNAFLFYLFLPLNSANAFCFRALSWFISSIILHHAQCILSVGFSLFYVNTVFINERAMCSLEK